MRRQGIMGLQCSFVSESRPLMRRSSDAWLFAAPAAGVHSASFPGGFPRHSAMFQASKARGQEAHGHHRDVSGGWLRPAVFGAMDGLVTNVSLIAGVGGGGGAQHLIVLTGLAGLAAGAF